MRRVGDEMRRTARLTIAGGALLVGAATPAFAQGPTAGSWEVTGGAVFVGGFDAGTRAAELTPNSGTSGSVTLFETESRVKPATGLLGKIGIYLTPSFAIEGGLRYTKPTYETRISDDFENADDLTAEETLSQYLFDVSAVWHFRGSGRGRPMPFVYGGAGYLRELHEGDTLVEDGLEIHAGGGVKWWFGAAGRWGFRAGAGISVRDGGFDPEEKRRIVPEANGSLIWVF
jgi:hypothetical protein